jgi:hypothetical protein
LFLGSGDNDLLVLGDGKKKVESDIQEKSWHKTVAFYKSEAKRPLP